MVKKKIQMIPPDNNYSDILHPETSADVVLVSDANSKLTATHVEGALEELVDRKIEKTEKASANGVATLGGDSKVPLTQLYDGTLTTKGVVQLNSSHASAAENVAATPKAVKAAYDLAASKATTDVATPSTNGLQSAADKAKLDSIQSNAEVNQNAFSNVSVNGTTLAADTKTDTLIITSTGAVVLTPNVNNDSFSITLNISDSTTTNNNAVVASAKAVNDLRTLSVLKGGSNVVTGDIQEEGVNLPNSNKPSIDLGAIVDNSHYRGFISNKTGYPESSGSLFGFKNTSTGYTMCWQIFLGSSANKTIYYRSAGTIDSWGSWQTIETTAGAQAKVNAHATDSVSHITAAERTAWNAKASGTHLHAISDIANLQTALDAKETPSGAQAKVDTHASNSSMHITEAERTAWNMKAGGAHNHGISEITNLQATLDGKLTTFQSLSGDMNNVKTTGFYYGYTMTNHALGNVNVISAFEVIRYSPDWVVQKQYVISNAGPKGNVYIRYFHSGNTWTPWVKLDDPTSHAHTISDVTNLQTTLDAKETPSGAQAKVNTHASNSTVHITAAERSAWNAKANASHFHSISDINGLQSSLNLKSDTNHSHDKLRIGGTGDGNSPFEMNYNSVTKSVEFNFF